MGDFFHGWRRKAGLITLAMSLAFVGAWVRSQFMIDEVVFPSGGHTSQIFVSLDRCLAWVGSYDNDAGPVSAFPEWESHPLSDTPDPFNDPEIQWQWRMWGIGLADVVADPADGSKSRLWVVSYMSVVLSLTLLSACLLLINPRSTKSATRAG